MLNYPCDLKSNRQGDSIMADIIAYFRVSTRKQGESGLGLEGQKEMESSRGERGKNGNEDAVVDTEENMKRRKYVKSLYI